MVILSQYAVEHWGLGDDLEALAEAERAVAAMAAAGNLTHDQPARRMFALALRIRALARDAIDSPKPVLFRSRSPAARTAWRELRFELELQAALGWAIKQDHALAGLAKVRGG